MDSRLVYSRPRPRLRGSRPRPRRLETKTQVSRTPSLDVGLRLQFVSRPPRRSCFSRRLSVCCQPKSHVLRILASMLISSLFLFVCVNVCSQFDSDRHHISQTGEHQNGEELVKFWKPPASRSGSRTSVLKDSSTMRDQGVFQRFRLYPWNN